MTIALGIATCGRPQTLLDVLSHLQSQTRSPQTTIVAYVESNDIGDGEVRFPDVKFIQSERGTCRQRNKIIDATQGCDLVLFLDDDFYPHAQYLESIEAVFANDSSVVAATGNILADGINGPGLGSIQAKMLLGCLKAMAEYQSFLPVFNTYGCNMSFRLATIMEYKIRFDENLPLYGWFEDVDFSRQIAPYGRVVEVCNAYGVHLGTKNGRTSGVRLGYSQVANPIYLAKKGTLEWFDAVLRIVTRLLKNLSRSVIPESYVDRRGRLRGNLLALRDLMLGSLHPTRIQEL